MGSPDLAVRTAAASLATDRVWPWWLERQRNLSSSAYVAPGEPARVSNVTGRNWTAIGTAGSAHRAVVDPAGAITPGGHGWSLDWLVEADGRWHVASRDPTVRQELVGLAPVVETRLRVPGGDVASVAYAVIGPSELGDVAVMELTNRSPAPVAVALVIRPADPEGIADVERIELVDRWVMVDGTCGLVLPRSPSMWVWSTPHAGVLPVLEAHERADAPNAVFCPRRLAEAAFVFPLPHRASLRAALPLVRPRRRRASPPPTVTLADSATVGRGWASYGGPGPITLPKGRWADALAANRRFLVLAARTDTLNPAATGRLPFDFGTAAVVVHALDRSGLEGEAAELLLSYPDRQRVDGRFGSSVGTTMAALAGLVGHWNLTRDAKVLEGTLRSTALAAGAVSRGTRPGLPADWARTLRGVATLLRAAGEERVASRVDDVASRCTTRPTATRPAAGGRAIAGPDGLDVRATLARAEEELAVGEPRLLDRLRWVLEAASPTFTWPAAVHRASGGGGGGDGHDGEVCARFVGLMSELVAASPEPGLLTVCPVWPDEWGREGVDVRDLPTACGRVSLAVRWHGRRPALLWEVEPHPDGGVTRIIAPGLDPGWSSVEARGEALLGTGGAIP